jgi:hypothetical protein
MFNRSSTQINAVLTATTPAFPVDQASTYATNTFVGTLALDVFVVGVYFFVSKRKKKEQHTAAD